MTYSTSTTILGPSRGDADTILAWAIRKGAARTDEVKRYLDTVYQIAPRIGMRAEVVVVQSIHETSEDGVPWTSSWWRGRLNPAGAGVTGDPKQDALSPRFADGEAAAYYQITHLWLYAVGIPLPTSLSSSSDPRWKEAVQAGYAGIAPTLDGLTDRWAMDNRNDNDTLSYADKIANRLNALDDAGLFGVTAPTTPPTGDSTVATTFKKYTLPGLSNPVYFPDWLIVEIKLIPSTVWGWTSGQYVSPSNFTTTTFHDTDNFTSNATSEYNWARNGGRGEIGSPGSYNGIYDGKRLIITQRFDELVGHAANPTGNVTSYAFEMAFGVDGYAASLVVGQWVHAGILQSMGKSGGTESMYLHQFWSRKRCSRQVLDHGDWGNVEKSVDAHVAEINAWVKAQAGDGTGGDTTPPPTTTYAKPVPIAELAGYTVAKDDEVAGIVTREGGDDFIYTADLYEAVVATPRLQYADIKNSPKVGPDLMPGEKFIGAWLVKARDGEWYIVTPYWTRILFKEGVVKRIGDVPNLMAGAA